MTFLEMLKGFGLQVGYMVLKTKASYPFLIYSGSGQNIVYAENTIAYKENFYQVEYYFRQKNEAEEKKFEDYLTSQGVSYSKSADVYIESEELYVIYYEVGRWLD